MANVIRSDIVQIGFDIDNNPLSALLQDINRLQDNVRRITGQPFDDLTRDIRNVTDASQLTQESLRDFRRRADQLGDVQGADELRQEIDRVSQQTTVTEQDLRQLQQAADRVGNSNGANNLRQDLNRADRSTEELRNSIQELTSAIRTSGRATNDISSGAREAENSINNATQASEGLKNALVGAAGAFAGFAIIDTINESTTSLGKFQAMTGASTAEMAEYSESIKNLYGNAMGESMEDVATQMALVKQVTGQTGDALEDTTNNALLMRDVFEFETNESIRAVDMMMKKFGVTSDEAYSMIAQGAQLGLNKNDDLLDTVNEYSVHFAQLGFSSEDMFNMLVNGAESGTFSVDKLGDAVKEFGIRAIDGSKSTAEGFSAIGLDADNMAKKFKEGGETGKAAFQETIDALKAMEDPIAREAAGVALFGTMWEDLGAEGVFALSNISGEVTKSTDTLNEMNQAMYKDLGSALEALKRKFGMVLSDALTPLVNKVINLINKFEAWADKSKVVDKVKTTVNNATTAVKDFATKINVVGKLKSTFTTVKNAIIPVATTISNTTKKVWEFATSDSTIATVSNAFQRVKDVVEPIISIAGNVLSKIIEFATAESTINTVKDAFNTVKDALDKIFEVAGEIFGYLSENLDVLTLAVGAFAAIWLTLKANMIATKVVTIALTAAQTAYNVVMGIANALAAVNPIQWIIMAIVALIAVIVLCVKYWDKIIVVVKKVVAVIVKIWGTIISWIYNNVIVPVVNFFKGLGEKIKAVFDAIKLKATTIFTAVVTWISQKIEQVKLFFSNLFTKISEIFNTIKTTISNVFTAIVEWISQKIQNIVGFFQNLWATITEIFSAVSSFFSNAFTSAVESIKSVFSTVIGFFQGIWDSIKSMFTKIGTTIGNGIGDAFKTVVNSVIGFAENTINGFIRAINNAIEFINAIPGVSISTIAELSIPRLAKGGIVDKPTIAEIGEDGKEAVVPLENNLEWVKTLARYAPEPTYTPENSVSNSSSEHIEYNTYSPNFTLNMNGASATDDNKKKVKQWIKESLEEVFDNLEIDNMPVVEV